MMFECIRSRLVYIMVYSINSLYLHIRKSSKTYTIRKRIKGKTQIITISKYPPLSLKDAKHKASGLAQNNEITKITISELIDKYYNKVIVPLSKVPKPKVPKQVKGYLNNLDDKFGRLRVRDVRKVDLTSYIESYSTERGARSADRLRSYLKQLFSFTSEMGYCEPSPMDGVTKRITGYTPIDRKRILSDDEIKMIWN